MNTVAAKPLAENVTEEHSSERLILFALWLLVFSASSQIMIVAPMLPEIGKQLDIPPSVQGTLVSAYALMVGLFALIIGPISDKVGRRKILLAGTLLMTFALAMHYVANGYVLLLLMRALAGCAGGVLSGSAVSYVGDYFPYERRGWANGWIMSSTALGQILGVPLGTLLAGAYGFRTPFLMFAVTMALTFLLVWRFVPQPNVERSKGKLTVKGALGNYWQLLQRGDVRAAACAFFLMFVSLSFYIIYLPTWLTTTLGATPNYIASLFLVGGIANAITGPLAGRLSDVTGRKKLIIGSCLGLALVMIVTTFLVKELWHAYPLFFFTMIVVAARMSPFQALLSALVTGAQRGTLMSFAIALGQVGFALGGALAGFAYTNFGYLSNTLMGAVAALLMALLVWRYLPEPRRAEPTTADTTQPDGIECA